MPKRIAVGVMLTALLIYAMPLTLNANGTYPPARLFVLPPLFRAPFPCQYYVGVFFDHVENLWSLNVTLFFNCTVARATSVVDRHFLNEPNTFNAAIDNQLGIVQIQASQTGSAQSKTGGCLPQLCDIFFNCTTVGNNTLRISVELFDKLGHTINAETHDGLVEQQTSPGYIVRPFTDYSPCGVPDFDQRQDQWDYPQGSGDWDFCGPTSAADALWWLDSKGETVYNPNPTPPPTISDSYPLVESYNPSSWDDHDPHNLPPLVEQLAFLMDTSGLRTKILHYGTYYIPDFATGIAQYLQIHGLSPLGDTDGDGVVNASDRSIVQVALDSVPGSANWDIRADLNQDNHVNATDLVIVDSNMGKTGLCSISTLRWPSFSDLQRQFLLGNAVILALDMFKNDSALDVGHFVALAGINYTTKEILLSDPFWNRFESNKSIGLMPTPHTHASGEPPCTLHNDAQYVSYDAYKVPSDSTSSYLSGYPAVALDIGNGEIYSAPPCYWRITYAYAISICLPMHNIVITDFPTFKSVVGQTMPMNFSAAVENPGNYTETFNVTAYANTTIIGTKPVTLTGRNSTTITFTWNTTGFVKGNYTISAYAEPVQGETDTSDNTLTDGLVYVGVPGDVDGNHKVDIKDILMLAKAYGTNPQSPNWNPNLDINSDDKVDIRDILIAAKNYGKTDP